jgi:hypothetical protein
VSVTSFESHNRVEQPEYLSGKTKVRRGRGRSFSTEEERRWLNKDYAKTGAGG